MFTFTLIVHTILEQLLISGILSGLNCESWSQNKNTDSSEINLLALQKWTESETTAQTENNEMLFMGKSGAGSLPIDGSVHSCNAFILDTSEQK